MASKLVLLCICMCFGIALSAPSYFTPFGSSVGDTQLYRNDDGYSGAISFNFKYFGSQQSIVYANNNGLLSFSGPVSTFTPQGLSSVGFPTVAPYWGDVDTRPSNGGEFWYRSSTNAAHMADVSAFIRATQGNDFIGIRMFVATWDNVGYFNQQTNKRCTFQAILIADEGDFSYVVFNYGTLQWTTGDASGGSNGLGGTPASAGFAGGPGKPYAQLQGSLTADILNVNQRSNAYINGVAQTGRYVFQVNEGVVIDHCCDTTTAPTLHGVPNSVTISCLDSVPSAPTVTATNRCPTGTPDSVVTPTTSTSTVGCTTTITRTWSSTDSCLRTTQHTQTITISDNIAPSINVPSTYSQECSAFGSWTVSPSSSGVASGSDSCFHGSDITYSDAPASISSTCANGVLASVSRTWRATDSCGNAATGVQTINTVSHNAPSYGSFQSSYNFECGFTSGIDNTQGSVNFACGLASETKNDVSHSSSCLDVASIDRTWTLTDYCGNSRSYPQQINIADTIAPSVTVDNQCSNPVNRLFSCFPLGSPSFIHGSDICTNDLTYSYNGDCVDNTGSDNYCVVYEGQLCVRAIPSVSSYTFSYTVSDRCGNTAQAPVTWTVGAGTNCVTPDTRIINSCDYAADDFADAHAEIDVVAIDTWGGEDAPRQYRVSATIYFNTLINDWRVQVELPNLGDTVVQTWGGYYSVYNGATFSCGSNGEGRFTVAPVADWVRNQPSVVFEYVVSNIGNFDEAAIRANTEFTVYTTLLS